MGAEYNLPIRVTCIFSWNSVSPVSDASADGAAAAVPANNNNNNNNNNNKWRCNISTLIQGIYTYIPETNHVSRVHT
jgi:hypothetical protein